MCSSSVRFIAVALMLCALSALIAAPSAADDNGVTWRPIEEWLAAQGTFCIRNPDGSCQQWLPPIESNFPAVANADGSLGAFIDYDGIVAEWLDKASGGMIRVPTRITGTVQEQALADGTASVKVDLMVRDAITWVVRDCIFPGPAIYGSRYNEILAGAKPALSDAHLELKFVNSAPGACLPDMIKLIDGMSAIVNIETLHIAANGEGLFRSVYGVPEGTPGRVHVTSNLLYNNFKKSVYGSPVSNIKLEEVQGKSQ